MMNDRLIRCLAAIWMLSCSSIQADDKPSARVGVSERSELSPKSSTVKNPSRIAVANCRIVLIKQVSLASDRTGVLKEIPFREGQRVEARSLVARIHDEVARKNLAVAEQKAKSDADIRFNRAARESAELELQKSIKANEESAKKNIVAVASNEIEKLKLSLTKTTLAIEHADNELQLNRLAAEQSRAELDTYSVMAPFDGVITRVYKDVGEAVRQGDPIVELVNVDRVRIEARVGLADIRRIRHKQNVRVRLADPEFTLPEETEEFTGTISFVDYTVDPVSRETRVWAEVDNRDNILRAGLLAEMEIDVENKSTATDTDAK